VFDELKKMMRPELLNRIDKTVVFRGLTRKDIYRIIDLQIDELRHRLQKRGLGIQVTPQTKQYLLDHGYEAKNGVRPLRRLIQDTIEDQIAVSLLSDQYQKGEIIKISAKNGELAYATHTE
jgi:ATP-dependent Clp protease ATP-binding subunit ClpA